MKQVLTALKSFMPAKIIQSQLHRRVFTQFAEKLGFVYFGYVDQREDEHRLVRGLTVSGTHRDNHYCIGSFNGYDVTIVERTDTLHFPGKPSKNHTWIIMAFDLHSIRDLPHVFMGLHTHSDTFYSHLFTKFAHLTRVPLAAAGTYEARFLQHNTLYSEPSQFHAVESLITPDVAKIVSDHFGSLTFELIENCLYVYTEHQLPTPQLLERMIKNGAWLARVIDDAGTEKETPA
jgi:hypothetical protein